MHLIYQVFLCRRVDLVSGIKYTPDYRFIHPPFIKNMFRVLNGIFPDFCKEILNEVLFEPKQSNGAQ